MQSSHTQSAVLNIAALDRFFANGFIFREHCLSGNSTRTSLNQSQRLVSGHDEQVKFKADDPYSRFTKESINSVLLPHVRAVNSHRNSYLDCAYFLERERSMFYQQCNARDVKNWNGLDAAWIRVCSPQRCAWQKASKQTNSALSSKFEAIVADASD